MNDEANRDTESGPPTDRAPRTAGDVGRPAAIQVALVLLVAFLVLLALWWLWPLLTGG